MNLNPWMKESERVAFLALFLRVFWDPSWCDGLLHFFWVVSSWKWKQETLESDDIHRSPVFSRFIFLAIKQFSHWLFPFLEIEAKKSYGDVWGFCWLSPSCRDQAWSRWLSWNKKARRRFTYWRCSQLPIIYTAVTNPMLLHTPK